MKIYSTLYILAVVTSLALSCHNGRKKGFHGRRKRSSDHDTRPYLSAFFTECMSRKAEKNMIPRWVSVVDFVLRDTIWYEASNKFFCHGNQDNFGCWQGIMDLLIDYDSKLLGPARECVLEYSKNETIGGYRQKRWAQQGQKNHDSSHRSCPTVSDAEFGNCVSSEIKQMYSFPSRSNFDFNSLAIFVRQHSTRCRIEEFEPKWKKRTKAYRRKCEGARFKGPNGDDVNNAAGQCLPLVIQDIIKEDAPLRPALRECDLRYEKYNYYQGYAGNGGGGHTEWDPVQNNDEKYDKNDIHNGADIIGHCAPDSIFTTWFDQISENGDRELLSELKSRFPGTIRCDKPGGIQIRVTRNNEPYYTAGNVLTNQSPHTGLLCKNSIQHDGKVCENFKVRFCCPNPSTQTIANSNDAEQHHEIAKTRNGQVGTCGLRDRWSSWMNIDTELGYGDYELFSNSGLKSCDPVAIQGRIFDSDRPYTDANNILEYESPSEGIVCVNAMQPGDIYCKDIEVRFCCRNGRGISPPRPPPSLHWLPPHSQPWPTNYFSYD